MIPKRIHYCWFGRGEKPKLAEKCITSWKKYCPDYEIFEWDRFDRILFFDQPFLADGFSIDEVSFVEELKEVSQTLVAHAF